MLDQGIRLFWALLVPHMRNTFFMSTVASISTLDGLERLCLLLCPTLLA